MNVVYERSQPRTLRRLPFFVSLSPQLVGRLSAVARENEFVSKQITGFLFGLAEEEFSAIQVLRSISPPPGTSRDTTAKGPPQSLVDTMLAQSKNDPELAGLKLLGWFSARKTSGLQDEDAAFHEKNFTGYNDVALIVTNEKASYFSLELYCRSLDGTGFRSGTARISRDSPTISPVEVPIKPKINDEIYMRAYQIADSGGDDLAPGWKGALASKTRKAFELLKTVKPERKGESALLKHASKEPGSEKLETLTSLSQALQFATRGEAAPAPARIREEPLELPQPVAETSEDVRRFDPEEPGIISLPEQPSSVAPEQETPAVSSQEHVVAREANKTDSPAVPAHSAPLSQALRLDSPPPSPTVVRSVDPAHTPPVPTQTARKLPWLALGLTFAVTTGGTFAFIYLRNTAGGGILPGLLQSVRSSQGLDLKLSKSGKRVQLSWNRNTPVTRNARQAILDINDGPDHRQLRLTESDVANGSILYLPHTDDVVFRLEVHGAAGQNVSESTRILDTATLKTAGASQAGKGPDGTRNSIPDPPRSKITAGQAQLPRSAAITGASFPPVKIGAQGSPGQDLQSKNKAQIQSRSPVPGGAVERPTVPAGDLSGTPAAKPAVPSNAPAARATPIRGPAPSAATADTEGTRVQRPQRRDLTGEEGAGQPGSDRSSSPDQKSAQINPTVTKPLLAYVPPRPIKQVPPNTTALSPGAGAATGEVRVVVRVSESGQVVAARLLQTSRNVDPSLVTAALSAAKQWVFVPALRHGRSVPSDHIILFQFRH